jgi:hypothetical protein
MTVTDLADACPGCGRPVLDTVMHDRPSDLPSEGVATFVGKPLDERSTVFDKLLWPWMVMSVGMVVMIIMYWPLPWYAMAAIAGGAPLALLANWGLLQFVLSAPQPLLVELDFDAQVVRVMELLRKGETRERHVPFEDVLAVESSRESATVKLRCKTLDSLWRMDRRDQIGLTNRMDQFERLRDLLNRISRRSPPMAWHRHWYMWLALSIVAGLMIVLILHLVLP